MRDVVRAVAEVMPYAQRRTLEGQTHVTIVLGELTQM